MNSVTILSPKDIDVVILCGGAGERLKSVINAVPKSMADINGRPFLDILIEHIKGFGFKRFILCTGYKSEVIEDYYRKKDFAVEIVFSREDMPLGTAGGLRNAKSYIKSSIFLVTNGDSLCKFDLDKFFKFYQKTGARYLIALIPSICSSDFGSVDIDEKGKITGFNEKARTKAGDFINAGIYLFDKSIFDIIEAGKKLSLEFDIFPLLTGKGLYGYKTDSDLLDIGTPERFFDAKKRLR